MPWNISLSELFMRSKSTYLENINWFGLNHFALARKPVTVASLINESNLVLK